MIEDIKNINVDEIDKFETLIDEWWDPNGKLRTLHHINPIRLDYIDKAVKLEGKKVLDIGCGGGILTEAMAEKNAMVSGLDASAAIIDAAIQHQKYTEKNINYHSATAEQFSQDNNQSFDVITCMELLEHIPDVQSLLQACAKMLRPDGHLILSTINRTMKSYLSAILAAEYLFQLLPKGTHNYSKFIKPSELSHWLRQSGFTVFDLAGMNYVPGINYCAITDNPSVNYLIHARLNIGK